MPRRLAALPGFVAALACPALADQVSVASSKDASIFSDANGALADGAGQYLFAGNSGDALPRRALFRFDLGAIPAGSVVSQVTLTLTVNRLAPSAAPTLPVYLKRLTRDWSEGASAPGGEEGGGAPAVAGDSTWLHTFYSTQFWTAPGGDVVPAVSAALDIVNDFNLPRPCTFGPSAGLASDVQGWVNAPASNFGWLMLGDESTNGTACRFDSRENTDPSTWPKLTVEFTPPPTCYPNCDHSTASPALNVQDFTCFLQKYASQDAYANCDGSTTAPTLNVQDFTCFLQKFAAGCSAP